jgi:hypothetical protein
LWKVPEDHDDSIQLHTFSGGKNTMFNLMAIIGVIGSSTTPQSISKIVTASNRGEDGIIFGKTNT